MKKILGKKIDENVNYKNIKLACKKKGYTIKELCKIIGTSRQNLYLRVHENTLRKIYSDKIESVLGIEYERD